MNERKDQNDNNFQEVNTDIIQEKIKAHPMSRKKMIKRMLWIALPGAVFGAVACLFFILLTPVFSYMLNPREEAVVGVSYPEETVSEELTPEEIRDNEEKRETEQEELIREEVEKALSENGDYSAVYSSLRSIAKNCDSWLVKVTTTSEDLDWLNNPYENEGTASGFVIAKNDTDILVMTCLTNFEDGEKLSVTFKGGETAVAKVRATDRKTHMTVLRVDPEDLSSNGLERISVAELGSSGSVNLVGSPVIAVGNPTSDDGSIIYGSVTSSSGKIILADSNYRQITTDMYTSSGASGVLVGMDGKVIGMIDMRHNRTDMPNVLCAIGISELKDLIEALSEGNQKPYLGAIYSDVPSGVRDRQKVPEGVFVTRVETDSPAMEAGLQNGDIIVSFGGKEITSGSALTKAILSSRTEQQVNISVLRASGDGYTEMVFNCALR